MFKSLQIGRALAAIFVVCFHLGAAISADKYFGQKIFGSLFLFGDSGVPYFFVLSGFLISFIHAGDLGQPGRIFDYCRKRALRIYPTYWMVFLAVFAAALAVPSLRETVPHDPRLIFKALTLVPLDAKVVGGTGAPVIIVAWTLQYEMLFYLLVGCAVLSRSLAVGLLVLLLVNGLACSTDSAVCEFPRSFVAKTWILLFLMGAAIAYAVRKGWRFGHPMAMACVGMLSLAVVFGLGDWTRFEFAYFDREVVLGLLSGLVIFALVNAEQQDPALFGQSLLLRVGDASYVLYLMHFPLISLFCKMALHLGLRGFTGALTAFIGILVSCIAISLVVHQHVEKPLLRRLQHRWNKRMVIPERGIVKDFGP